MRTSRQKTSLQAHFVSLPDALLRNILGFLSARDVAALSLVDRQLRLLAGDEELWDSFLGRDFRLVSSSVGAPRFGLIGPDDEALEAADRLCTAPGSPRSPRSPRSAGSPLSASIRTPRSPQLLGAANIVGPSVRSGAPSASRLQDYRAKFAKHAQVASHDQRVRHRARAHVIAVYNRFVLRRILDAAQFGCGMMLWPILIFLWLLLLLLRLTGWTPSLSWGAIFAPLIAMPVILVSCMGLGLLTRFLSVRATQEYEDAKILGNSTSGGATAPLRLQPVPSVWVAQHLGDKNNLADCAVQVLQHRLSLRGTCWVVARRLVIPLFIASLIIAPIVDLAKASDAISISWVAAFTPTWVFLLLLPATPYTGLMPCITSWGERRVFALLLTIVGVVAGSQLALSASAMDGKDIAPAVVMIPMWITAAALGTLACGMIGLALCRCRRPRDRRLAAMGCGLLTAVGGFLGSMLPALSAWQDGDMEKMARSLLVPLVLLFAAAAAGWLVVSNKMYLKARARAFRRVLDPTWLRSIKTARKMMPAGHGAHPTLIQLAANMEAATRGHGAAGMRVVGMPAVDDGMPV